MTEAGILSVTIWSPLLQPLTSSDNKTTVRGTERSSDPQAISFKVKLPKGVDFKDVSQRAKAVSSRYGLIIDIRGLFTTEIYITGQAIDNVIEQIHGTYGNDQLLTVLAYGFWLGLAVLASEDPAPGISEKLSELRKVVEYLINGPGVVAD